jgi:hypothetical protein
MNSLCDYYVCGADRIGVLCEWAYYVNCSLTIVLSNSPSSTELQNNRPNVAHLFE